MAKNSYDSFLHPPLDLPVDLALDFHLIRNPGHPIFTHPTADTVKTYTYADFVPTVHRTGSLILKELQNAGRPATSGTVAILLETDPLTYLTVLAALMRVGITAFPISYKFSASVVSHLLRESQAVAMIINASTKTLANQSIDEYATGSTNPPLVFQLPPFSSLRQEGNEYASLPDHRRAPKDIAMIIHSSSSTSVFPKIIPWSGAAITYYAEVEETPPHNLAGQILCGYGLEFFHSIGSCIFFKMIRKGLVLGIQDPSTTPVSNPDGVFRWLMKSRPNFIMTNPYAIETWCEDKDKVDQLYDLGANVIFGGKFLRQSVGDMLAHKGVKISSAYGSTETGPISILPPFQTGSWDYFTVTQPRPDLNFILREDGLLELIVSPVDPESDHLGIRNTMWNGRPAYNPGDLFIRHPTQPHRYRMFGRLNDQILLATGETINPIEIETELSKHPLIASAVMFGQNRPAVGVVIEPAEVISGPQEASALLDSILPTIEKINLNYPPYSALSRTMIIVSSVEKPISISPKGLPRRPLVLQQYQDEIAALYKI